MTLIRLCPIHVGHSLNRKLYNRYSVNNHRKVLLIRKSSDKDKSKKKSNSGKHKPAKPVKPKKGDTDPSSPAVDSQATRRPVRE